MAGTLDGVIRIVLASTSPRRQALLRQLGLSFEVIPVSVDEREQTGETPTELVARLSRAKADAGWRALAERRPEAAGALVVAADTVVVLGDEVLGKPSDPLQNRSFLARLSGRTHQVLTGHTLRRVRNGGSTAAAGETDELLSATTTVVRTSVHVRELDADEIARYVASGEGADKAGGYAVQGRGAGLVRAIEGCYSNVVGLSLPSVIEAAKGLGVTLV